MRRLVFHLMEIAILLVIVQLFISCQKQQNDIKKIDPIIDKYLSAWNTGNLEELDAITINEFELRITPDFEPRIGRELLKEEITNTRKGFPDLNINEDKRLFVGDSAVVIHWILTGTNTGNSSMPPTGNSVNLPGFSVIFFSDSLITGEWIAFSDLMWVRQLGFNIIPPEFNQQLE